MTTAEAGAKIPSAIQAVQVSATAVGDVEKLIELFRETVRSGNLQQFEQIFTARNSRLIPSYVKGFALYDAINDRQLHFAKRLIRSGMSMSSERLLKAIQNAQKNNWPGIVLELKRWQDNGNGGVSF